jgi:hypothetical protein
MAPGQVTSDDILEFDLDGAPLNANAVYTELNARYQCEAMGLGEVVYLTKEEGETAVRTVEQQSNRAWNLWKEQATQRRREA